LGLGCFGRLILGCLVTKVPGVRQGSVLACQTVPLSGLDSFDALRSRHLHGSIGNMDDHHKLEEERPFEDAILSDVEAHDFKC
jgi:hypothetical protein